MRVMHISRGLPLISAEQEPHFPALQFQRTARSCACVAWIWWIASSTTMPGTTSTEKSSKCPPDESVLQTLNSALVIALPCRSSALLLLNDLRQLGRHRRNRRTPDFHRAVGRSLRDDVEGRVLGALVRVILAKVAAAAFLALERGSGDRLRHGEKVA